MRMAGFGNAAPAAGRAPLIHDPRLDAMSFYVSTSSNCEVVSYAALVRMTISHAGKCLSIGGLSWVATDPGTVSAATHEHRASPPIGHTGAHAKRPRRSPPRRPDAKKPLPRSGSRQPAEKKKAPCGKPPHGAFPRLAKRTPNDSRRASDCAYCCAAAARSFDTSFSLIRADLPERSRR